jgi:hypothetical protein
MLSPRTTPFAWRTQVVGAVTELQVSAKGDQGFDALLQGSPEGEPPPVDDPPPSSFDWRDQAGQTDDDG